MDIDFSSDKPIFLQIAEGMEDAILSGAFPEESQIPSITEFSVQYKINPATALKGINVLVEQGVVYKKRGLGMFVARDAAGLLREKRKDAFFESFILSLVEEAKRLGISPVEIEQMIVRGFSDERNSD